MHRKFFLFVPLVMLAGCMAPKLGPAPVPRLSASVLASQSVAGQPARDWPAEGWWTAWGDPQLDALVAEALAGNPDLAAAEARLAAADAAALQARAALRPTLVRNTSVGGQQLSRNMGFPPQFVPSGILESGLINTQAGWVIDLWGGARAGLRAARREAEAVAVERAQARLMLAASVAAAYADFAAAMDREAVARRALAIRQQTLALTQARVTAGLDNDGARAQAASRLALAEADVAAAAQQVRVTRHRLGLLAGAGPDRGLRLIAPAVRALPPGLPADVPINLVARRPDLVAARLRVAAAGLRETEARRSFLPNLTLQATVGQQSLGFDKLLNSDSLYAQFGPALSLPILDGGRRTANLRASRAAVMAAVAAWDAGLLRALGEVADAAGAVTTLAEQEAAAQRALAEAEAARRVAALRYDAGLSNQLLVLTADDAVVAAERTRAELAAQRLAADVALVRALGGGYRSEESK